MPYMYTDQPEHIDFIADMGIIDQIIDWFGSDIRIGKTDEESKVKVSVKASPNAIVLDHPESDLLLAGLSKPDHSKP